MINEMPFNKKISNNHHQAGDDDHDEEQGDCCSSNQKPSSKSSTTVDFAGNIVSCKLPSSSPDPCKFDKGHGSFCNKDQTSTSGDTYETDLTQRDLECQDPLMILPEEDERDHHAQQECKNKQSKDKKNMNKHNNNTTKKNSKKGNGRRGGGEEEEEEQNCIKVTVVADLDVYDGETLEEQVDSFINAHPVVMFQKTWCLFSIDAQLFMTEQMQVSVHTMELDVHPHGKAIQKHIQQKTGHNTVPIIYVKGEFLGGFEDVNQLYATGQLQDEYLKDLTQADRCEEFLVKANIGIEPLFWFPATVNAHVIRLTGILTCLCSLLSAVSVHWFPWGRYVAYGLFFDFVMRFFAGSRLSVLGRIATILTSPIQPKPRHGRPKQFATMCGILFSGLGSLFFVLSFPKSDYVGVAFMGGLAMATGMEGFLDFCVGCVIFKYGIKLGLIPKG